jgi:putative transposase
MMLDHDVVAVSPTGVYRVLKGAGLLDRNRWAPSKKGKGFVQPLHADEHWHVDISYLNVAGTFYFLCSVLDGYSRAIVHMEIRETMKGQEVDTVVQRALEKHLGHKPRIISDNGPQFIPKDFKQFIRLAGITHIRTSPCYPQSNGKLERWHGTLNGEHFRDKSPRDVEEARRVVGNFVAHYNEVRLHSVLGYITPRDKLVGRVEEIFANRDSRFEAARAKRLGAKARAAEKEITQSVTV